MGNKRRLNAVTKDGYIISGARLSASWQDLISPQSSRGQLAFQFWKAEDLISIDKQFKNEDFLDGIEEGTVQAHTAPLCDVWQITPLKPCAEMQGNHLRGAASLPRGSTDWFTALQLRKAFQKPLCSMFPTGEWGFSETLKQECNINFRPDALPHFTMCTNLTPCQAVGNKVTAQMLGN